MKALRLERIGHLALADVARPSIQTNELLIRTGAATICTSDLHDIQANPFGIDLPAVLGHEGAGSVVEVGQAVEGFRVGDRVAAHPVHPCNACGTCREGWGHLCPTLRHFGITMPGTFAEYFVVRADRARVLPPGVDVAVAALTEPVAVSLEALGQARLEADRSLLIIGDGPFGVLMARLASRYTRGPVVLAGRHEFRLGFARSARTINVGGVELARTAIWDASDGMGYDATILTVGSHAALADGLAVLKPKGRLVLFAPMLDPAPVNLLDVTLKELEIVGSVNDHNRLDDAVWALADPDLDLADLVTHRVAIDEYRRAFALAKGGRREAMKVALTFEGGSE